MNHWSTGREMSMFMGFGLRIVLLHSGFAVGDLC